MEVTRRGFMGAVAAGLAAARAEWIGTPTVEEVALEGGTKPVLWIGEDAFKVESVSMVEEPLLLDISTKDGLEVMQGRIDRTLEFECEQNEELYRNLMGKLYECEVQADLKVRMPEGDVYRSKGVMASLEGDERRLSCEVMVDEEWELM